MDIKTILQNFDKNIINEETATEIVNAFEKAVTEKTKTQAELMVEKALMEQDEDHAKKLQAILEKADEDHVKKLKMVVKAITENHTHKLSNIIRFYKKTVNEKANNFSKKIVTDLDKFLGKYLENKIPYSQITEAVNNTYASKKLQEIRKLVSFDPSLVSESVKSVVTEGKETIDKLSEQLNLVNEENSKLQRELGRQKAVILIEGKTRGMPKSKKDFVSKLLSDKDVKYIKENFDYVVEMFENGERGEVEKLGSEAKANAISRDAKPPKVISESSNTVTSGKSGGLVGEYLSELNRLV